MNVGWVSYHEFTRWLLILPYWVLARVLISYLQAVYTLGNGVLQSADEYT